MALGNLLGRPGDFYPIVTGDSAARSIALERLQQDAQKTLSRLAGGGKAGAESREVREALARGCWRLKDAAEAAAHAALIDGLCAVLLTLCGMYAGREVPEDEALGFAFMHSPTLGLGLWFATEVRSRLDRLRGSALLEIDALLGMYFLSVYREGAEEDE